MPRSRAPNSMGWVVALFAGCVATWASGAFGLRVADYCTCRFGASPLPAPPPTPPAPPPEPPVAVAAEPPPAATAPEPEADEEPDDPPEIYERPSINLHCGDARYLAIRRSALAYCRKHPEDRGSSFVCPAIIQQLRRCPRNGVALSLSCPSQLAGKDKPDCDDADVWMDPVDGMEEIIPYLEVVHEHGRWSVTGVGYDDMERP